MFVDRCPLAPVRWQPGGRILRLSWVSRGELAESFGDRFDGRLSGGDVDHEAVDVIVVGASDLDAVDLEDHSGRQPSNALVAVDEGIVLDDRMQQRGGFRPNVRVSVLAERVVCGRATADPSRPTSRIGAGSPRSAMARWTTSSRSRKSTGSFTRRADARRCCGCP